MPTQIGTYIDVAIAVMATVVIYTSTPFSNWLRVYFFLPVLLLWVHGVGSVFQGIDYGSEWVQNHMHNLGVPAWGMCAAMVFASKLLDRNLAKSSVSERHAGAKSIMTCAVGGWLVVAAFGIASEVIHITLLREDSVQQGYSGKLDWLDILSYVVGAALVYLNHRTLNPIVLRNVVPRRRH